MSDEDAAYNNDDTFEPDIDTSLEVQLAGDAFEEGDHTTALRHLSRALSRDPSHSDAQALVDQMLQSLDEPLSLVPLYEGIDYSSAALHALFLARLGRRGEAIELILQVLRVRPDSAYDLWLKDWLQDPQQHQGEINPVFFQAFLRGWLEKFPELQKSDRFDDMAEQLPGILDALIDNWLDGPATSCLVLGASVLRRLGHNEKALTWAERAHKESPGWQTAVGQAMALADLERFEEAVASYEEAIRYEPDDLTARLDLAELLIRQRRFRDGIACYEQVLEREPEHSWALPAKLYTAWLGCGEEEAGLALKQYAEANPENHRAASLAADFDAQQSVFIKWLPEPSDCIIEVAMETVKQGSGVRLTELSSSALETPSARYASNWFLSLHDCDPLPSMTITKLQEPDPREPLGEPKFQLWRYHGMEPKAQFGKASDEVMERCAELAREDYHLHAWWQYARPVARDLGTQARDDLLGVMVRPPKLPDDIKPWHWMQKVQLAAVLIIAHLDSGWEGTVRRETLLSLLCGPNDWSVAAAALALSQVPKETPEALTEIAQAFSDRLETVPRNGPVCYTFPLICSTLWLPGLDAETQSQLESWKRDFYEPAL